MYLLNTNQGIGLFRTLSFKLNLNLRLLYNTFLVSVFLNIFKEISISLIELMFLLLQEGSYECKCESGHVLAEDKHACETVSAEDECAKGDAGCSHSCVVQKGQAFCTCPDGWELGEDWKTCQGMYVYGSLFRKKLIMLK